MDNFRPLDRPSNTLGGHSLAYYCKELTVVDNRERRPWLTNFSEHDYNKVLISRILCDFTMLDIKYRFH